MSKTTQTQPEPEPAKSAAQWQAETEDLVARLAQQVMSDDLERANLARQLGLEPDPSPQCARDWAAWEIEHRARLESDSSGGQ